LGKREGGLERERQIRRDRGRDRGRETAKKRRWQGQRLRENQRMSMRDLEVLSSIDPIITTSTSTGDSECVSK
jgi:hypothetical protein